LWTIPKHEAIEYRIIAHLFFLSLAGYTRYNCLGACFSNRRIPSNSHLKDLSQMAIQIIHSFLVHPDKGEEEQTPIRGTKITGTGQLSDMLATIYRAAPIECRYDISFQPNQDGQQQNDCRDLFVAYIRDPSKQHGELIAQRLQSITTNRSGLGLLFIILGTEGNKHRLVVSRFPADNGILAEENRNSLNVKFIERIFMKSATAYKSAVYEGASLQSHFWTGKAIDKQINGDITISDYWIRDFLLSDFAVTGARGTRRLAVALRDAMSATESMEVKQELAAAARLAPNLDGRVISAATFAAQYHLSIEAKEAFRKPLKNDQLYAEEFRFSRDEFASHLAFRSVELDNGALLTAGSSNFDDVFKREQIRDQGRVRISTTGRIVNDRLRKGKP
jgi:hypothetical protein